MYKQEVSDFLENIKKKGIFDKVLNFIGTEYLSDIPIEDIINIVKSRYNVLIPRGFFINE